MIFSVELPTDTKHHPTRSIHKGRHLEVVSKELGEQMDLKLNQGKSEGWSMDQYREALYEIVSKERSMLRSGERALHGREDLKREWSEVQQNDKGK